MHASPSDAVAIHKAVRSRHSIAMHFGTFAGSETEMVEPLVELKLAKEKESVGEWWEQDGFGAIDIGETIEVSVDEGQKDKKDSTEDA